MIVNFQPDMTVIDIFFCPVLHRICHSVINFGGSNHGQERALMFPSAPITYWRNASLKQASFTLKHI